MFSDTSRFISEVPSMWFWSVSWSTNCPVYFSIFLVDQKKFVHSQIFFVHSLEFFVQSFLKMWFWSVSWLTNCPVNFSFFEKDWTKNSREWTKKIWDWTNFFLVNQKKLEIDRTIGQPRDWPKPHGRDLWARGKRNHKFRVKRNRSKYPPST